MKKTRRHFTREQREEIVQRDGDRCVICHAKGNDFDHAYRLSTALPFITETWNGNVLCRSCHEHVTNPDTESKWRKSIKVMELALHRLYETHRDMSDYRAHYMYYKAHISRFKMLYHKPY